MLSFIFCDIFISKNAPYINVNVIFWYFPHPPCVKYWSDHTISLDFVLFEDWTICTNKFESYYTLLHYLWRCWGLKKALWGEKSEKSLNSGNMFPMWTATYPFELSAYINIYIGASSGPNYKSCSQFRLR